jgi:hypothetical protein
MSPSDDPALVGPLMLEFVDRAEGEGNRAKADVKQVDER